MFTYNTLGEGCYVLPVSTGQEHLWFLSSIDEKFSAAYNISTAFKIKTNINRIALQSAINYVVSRHEALRTAICKIDGELKQIVDPNLMIILQYFDFMELNPTVKEEELFKKLQSEAKKPFVLSIPGLFRVYLYRAECDVFYLSLVLHHSIADGISLEILNREIFTVYLQMQNNGNANLPPLKYHFADIVAWQQEKLTPNHIKEHMEYWKQKLQGVNTQILLDRVQIRKGKRSFDGRTLSFIIEKTILDSISNRCKKLQISTYCLLISAFALLIHYNSGQSDFLIGIPTANRDHKETWSIIGYFANTVVIRVNLNLVDTIQDLLLQIQKSINDALIHQALPISKVVEILKPERTGDFGTIFQFMFSYQESYDFRQILNSFNAEQFLVDNKLSKMDVFLFLYNQGESLQGIVEYSTELFEYDYILRLIQHFQALCSALADDNLSSMYDTKLLSGINLSTMTERIKKAEANLTQDTKKDTLGRSNREASTPLEEQLISIWQDILNIEEPISPCDNFFDLGGNSLLIAKFVEHTYNVLKINLPIKIIFLHPCIREITKYINSLNSEESISWDLFEDSVA